MSELKNLYQHWPCGLIVLLYLFIYAPTYTTPYIMDDSHTISSNQFIHSLKYFFEPWKTAKAYSSSPENYGYRPLTANFSQVMWALGNGSSVAFQIAKKLILILVALMTFLAWSEWKKLLPDLKRSNEQSAHRWRLPGFFVFGFFLLHPVATQVANYVAASSTLLCSLFYMSGFFFYLKFRQERRWFFLGLAALTYFLAVMSKEEGITLVALLFLTEIFYLRKKSSWAYAGLAIMGATSALSAGLIALHFEPSSNIARGSITSVLYFATQWRAYLFYMSTYFWPFQFNFDNQSFQFAKSLWTLENISYLFLNIFVITGGLFLSWRKSPLGIALLGFYIAILPASSVIPLAEPVNDHRHFISFLFFGFGLIHLLEQSLSQFIGTDSWKKTAAVSGVLIFLSGATLYRNFDFVSNRTLWVDTVLKNPESGRAKNNLAVEYLATAQFDLAERLLKSCIETNAYYAPCFINLGVTYHANGNQTEAEYYFKKAISIDTGYMSSRIFYADYLMTAGRDSDAKIYLDEADHFATGLNQPVRERLAAIESRAGAKQ